jgi:hypothetical protein
MTAESLCRKRVPTIVGNLLLAVVCSLSSLKSAKEWTQPRDLHLVKKENQIEIPICVPPGDVWVLGLTAE